MGQENTLFLGSIAQGKQRERWDVNLFLVKVFTATFIFSRDREGER